MIILDATIGNTLIPREAIGTMKTIRRRCDPPIVGTGHVIFGVTYRAIDHKYQHINFILY